MQYLSKDELRRLFQVAYDNNRRHHLFLVVCLWHGCRVSEGIALTGEQVSRSGEITVRRLKRSLPTCQPIHRDADPLFDETPLLELARSTPGRLFPFNRQRADAFIKRYCALAGINRDKAHCHSLKHSVAMLLWDATQNLGQIQSYLGHKAASSTLVYLFEADARKAQQAIAGISI
jgi:integrase/recombinase XerD